MKGNVNSVVNKILEGADVRKSLSESVEYITPQVLDKIKKFAADQFDLAGEIGDQDMISVKYHGINVIDPWTDLSGRYSLDDVGAVEEYGLDKVLSFCILALDKI